jgi:hypothetical protein
MLVALRSVSHCPRLVAKTQTRDHALIYADLVITARSAAFRLACLMIDAAVLAECRTPYIVHGSGTALLWSAVLEQPPSQLGNRKQEVRNTDEPPACSNSAGGGKGPLRTPQRYPEMRTALDPIWQ